MDNGTVQCLWPVSISRENAIICISFCERSGPLKIAAGLLAEDRNLLKLCALSLFRIYSAENCDFVIIYDSPAAVRTDIG